MAVDLGDLIESLQREVNPPGSDLFPGATDDDYLGNLADAFWEARLDGLLVGFEEADFSITPTADGGDDLTRDLQQLIVFYAGVKIVRNVLRSIKNSTRYVAGSVEYEVQVSSNMLRDVLAELKDKRNLMLTRLGDLGTIPTYYVDTLIAREDSMTYGDVYWVNA